ncbi:MAG: sugar phosphate nucleotidyltransferase [bacterium]
MKIIIFAGGIGTRLWPLSRKNSPKQFDKIFNGKSTLELAIERVKPLVGIENIFIQTTSEFADAVRAHIPALPAENIFIEPSRRNVGPAVCYGMFRLRNANSRELESESTRITGKNNEFVAGDAGGRDAINRISTTKDESVALLWADHLMERVDEFRNALVLGEKLINEDHARFIFLAERPRFANNNLGWIKVGEKAGECGANAAVPGGDCGGVSELENDGRDAINRMHGDVGCRDALQCVSAGNEYFKFLGWKYKPTPEECDRMFKSGEYFWNPGYFISSVEFILKQYEKLAPSSYENVKNAVAYPEDAFEHYEKAEKVSFDRAILEKTNLSQAVVIKTNMGWSDPGTLYALKEALEKSKEDNVVKGQVVSLNTKDSLLYNFDKKKLLTAVGLDGFVVINTDDAIIVVPKDEVVNVTKLVEKIGAEKFEEYL